MEILKSINHRFSDSQLAEITKVVYRWEDAIYCPGQFKKFDITLNKTAQYYVLSLLNKQYNFPLVKIDLTGEDYVLRFNDRYPQLPNIHVKAKIDGVSMWHCRTLCIKDFESIAFVNIKRFSYATICAIIPWQKAKPLTVKNCLLNKTLEEYKNVNRRC